MSFRAVAGDVLSLDAVGTVIRPARPVAEVYAEHARACGHPVSVAEVEARLGPAMRDRSDRRADDPAWLRYWQRVVRCATGVQDDAVFEALYDHYGHGVAWQVDPQARWIAARMRERGVKVALVSNFDRRLRALAAALGLSDWLDLLVVSGEEGIEKPNPEIFARVAERLDVGCERILHVGDSRSVDVAGARAAGCEALWFGHDVRTFAEIAPRYGLGP